MKNTDEKKKYDDMILADGICSTFDSARTGLNNNVMVIGPPGSGKTFSVTEPQILHSFENSLIVTMTKRRVADKYAFLLSERGYRVAVLDLVHPEKSDAGFDPLDYVTDQADTVDIAKQIINISKRYGEGARDPYWDNTAVSLICAEMCGLFEKWMESDENAAPVMENVLLLHKKLKFTGYDSCGFTRSTLDPFFESLKLANPDSYSAECWSAIQGLTSKTVSCILSTVNTGYAGTFTPKIRRIINLPSVNIKKFGCEKCALFIITSPVDTSSHAFTNLIYSTVFKELFNFAQECPGYRLPVPVHIICDDFATGAQIPHFTDYISVFRETGISFTILVQSESQLDALYGTMESNTIKTNCDRTVYFGGNDLATCTNIARRMNIPVSAVQNLPIGKVIVLERGTRPVYADRYKILTDPFYKNISS